MAKALREEGDEGDFFRVTMYPPEAVISPRYALDFESELRPGDVVFTFGSIKVVADHDTVIRMRGTVVDYIAGPDGTGFQFNNPNEPITGLGTLPHHRPTSKGLPAENTLCVQGKM
jgi:Fe-S cluster assembly iron-binding protein IscA